MHDTTPPLRPVRPLFARAPEGALGPRLARLLEAARSRLAWFHRRSVPPPVAALELLLAGWLSQALCVAAKLGIADALEGGAASPGELAKQLGCSEDALRRLLRALAQHGVFHLRADGRYEQSALSASLRSDAPNSIRNFALYVGSEQHRAHWSQLERSIRTGEPSIAQLRGRPFFEYTRECSSFGALFNGAMTGLADLAEEALLSHYDFSRFGTIVDVGGGEGRLLAAILQRAPRARGVLFDLPEVSARAPALLSALGVSERCSVESGSFLTSVPAHGDAYVLKHIVHDWSDDRAVEILRRVRSAMAGDGTLLLFESVVPEGPSPHLAKLTDLEMLLCLGGRERSKAEFATLLEAAGFTLSRIIATVAPISILEARPSQAAVSRASEE